MPAFLVTMVGVYFFTVRFYHALPLIIDRNYGAIDSLKGSWKLTQGHFWMTFLIIFLIGMINGAARRCATSACCSPSRWASSSMRPVTC